jgi:hypothetical protein
VQVVAAGNKRPWCRTVSIVQHTAASQKPVTDAVAWACPRSHSLEGQSKSKADS